MSGDASRSEVAASDAKSRAEHRIARVVGNEVETDRVEVGIVIIVGLLDGRRIRAHRKRRKSDAHRARRDSPAPT